MTTATARRRMSTRTVVAFTGCTDRMLEWALRNGLFAHWGMAAEDAFTGSGFRRDWPDDAVIAAWAAAQLVRFTGWSFPEALRRLAEADDHAGDDLIIWHQLDDETGGEMTVAVPAGEARRRLAELREK